MSVSAHYIGEAVSQRFRLKQEGDHQGGDTEGWVSKQPLWKPQFMFLRPPATLLILMLIIDCLFFQLHLFFLPL